MIGVEKTRFLCLNYDFDNKWLEMLIDTFVKFATDAIGDHKSIITVSTTKLIQQNSTVSSVHKLFKIEQI
jgi:hypothetical protein